MIALRLVVAVYAMGAAACALWFARKVPFESWCDAPFLDERHKTRKLYLTGVALASALWPAVLALFAVARATRNVDWSDDDDDPEGGVKQS